MFSMSEHLQNVQVFVLVLVYFYYTVQCYSTAVWEKGGWVGTFLHKVGVLRALYIDTKCSHLHYIANF